MKSIFCFLLTLTFTANGQALGVVAGRSLFPSDFIGIQYFHPSNYPLYLSGEVYTEASKHHSLHYRSFGSTISLNYSSAYDSYEISDLRYRLGLGTTLQFEKEPWVLSGQQKTAIGFTGEAAGEWMLSSAFRLSLFVKQRWFLKQALGNRQLVFGIGLIYELNATN